MNFLHKIIMVCVMFAIGCGSMNVRTDSQSYKDPLCSAKTIKKILVYANTKDLQYQNYIETELVNYITRWNYDCIAVKSSEIVLPTRTYTEKELKQLFSSHSIDAILAFTVQNAGYNHQQFTYNQPYQTYGNIYNYGSNAYSYSARTYGGPQTYNFYKPYLGAVADLYDISTGTKIWVVQLQSYGNAFAKIDDTLDDAIKTVVVKMEQDGIIKQRKE